MQPQYTRNFNWKEIEEFSTTHTVKECALQFGFSTSLWTKAVRKGWVKSKDIQIPLEVMAVENSKHGRGCVKRKIIKSNIIEYKCIKCGNDGNWMDNKLSLILDHINGVKNDHRLDNLRFLCPNCNSQTPTFSGRNVKHEPLKDRYCNCGNKISSHSQTGVCRDCFHKKRSESCVEIPKISKEELINLIKTKPIRIIVLELKIRSHFIITKWCRYYNINHKDLSPFSRTNRKKKIKQLVSRNLTSKYKNVFFEKSRNKWQVRIKKNKKIIFLKRFNNEIDAANEVSRFYNSKELILK